MNQRENETVADRTPVERGEINNEVDNRVVDADGRVSERDDTPVQQTQATSETFLPQDRLDDLRSKWDDIQAQFVDDPRQAVTQAQQLVGTVVDELTQTFQRQRGNLEGQWTSGGGVDTEMLRVTLQRYRDFFNRLLATSE